MPNFDDLIFCVFSFNRYRYLKNLVSSIDAFYPDVTVVIFDDNSTEQELLDYYKQLDLKENYSIIKQNAASTDKSKHGGLYQQMNTALDYCWEKNINFVFFIQDDMQFVQSLDLPALCKQYFMKRENVLMFSPLFMQKIFLPEIEKYIGKKEGTYFFKEYGVADAGIINLGRAKAAGLQFSSRGEKYNGNIYHDLGYRLILAMNPCLAWVPWAISYKHDTRKGVFLYRKDRLFIKPLSGEKRDKLLNNNDIPFLEDFTRLNVWWIPRPYIHLMYGFKHLLTTYWNYIKFSLAGK